MGYVFQRSLTLVVLRWAMTLLQMCHKAGVEQEETKLGEEAHCQI